MRRRARLGRDQPASSKLPLLHLDEGEPLSLKRHEINLADRRLVAARDDAMALEAKQKRGDRFGE
jgi:hypothetical protein